MGRPGRTLLALVLGGLLAGALVAPVSAHSHVASSTPAPEAVVTNSPAQLTLKFDSPLNDSGNDVQVYHSDRRSIGKLDFQFDHAKLPTATIALPTLDPDIYTVGWTSSSADDGHILKQFFSFSLGAPPDASTPPVLPPLTVGDTRVNLKLARGNVGPMVIDSSVTDASGKPVINLQRVIFRYQPTGLDLGQVDAIAPAQGSNARTPAFTLGLSGDWDVTVIVRRVGMDDVSAPLKLSIQGSAKPSATIIPPTETAVSPAGTVPSTVESPTVAIPATQIATVASTGTAVTAPATFAATAAATVTPTASPSTSSALPIGMIGVGAIVVVGIVAAAVAVVRRRR